MIEEGDVVKKVGPCNEGNYCYRKDEKAITMCDLTYYYRGKSEYKATRLVDIKRASEEDLHSKLLTKSRQRWLCCKFSVALKA